VENSVDYFRQFRAKIQNYPLAKGGSFLVDGATPYLSISIKRVHDFVGSWLQRWYPRVLTLGYPQIPMNKL
jgi:hypothetical protein